MARSRRRTPICGWTTSSSNKWFKRFEHRAERAMVRMAVLAGNEELLHPKATGNEWDSPRDGKQYFGNRHPHLMRK